MTDFYLQMFGRPNPGQRPRDRRYRYLHGEEDREVDAFAGGVEHARRSAWRASAGEPRPEWAREENMRRRPLLPDAPPTARGVPFGAVAGTDRRPYGTDFAEWHNDAYGPQPVDRPSPPQAVPERRGFEPPDAPRNNDLNEDEWSAWHAAQRRAAERYATGAPSVTDMFFAAVFGNRPLTRLENANDELQDRIRRGDY